MTRHRRDEAWLVWVAARATRCPAQRLLDAADMAALVSVTADMETVGTADGWTQAATAIDAIVRRRPFPAGNRAVAWMAALVVLAEAGIEARIDDDTVIELIDDVAGGDRAVHQLAASLADAAGTSGGGRTLSWSCPACGRTLHTYELHQPRNAPLLIGPSRYELTARCWYEHGAHDRSGRPMPRHDDDAERDAWRPIVSDRRSGAVLVLGDDSAVLLSPEGATTFSVTRHGEVTPGDLAGSWDGLRDAGEPVGVVPAGAIRFDPSGTTIDWNRLAGALPVPV